MFINRVRFEPVHRLEPARLRRSDQLDRAVDGEDRMVDEPAEDCIFWLARPVTGDLEPSGAALPDGRTRLGSKLLRCA